MVQDESELFKVQRRIREDMGLPEHDVPLSAPLGDTLDIISPRRLPWQSELPDSLREQVIKKLPEPL
jgi:hypothetical protein